MTTPDLINSLYEGLGSVFIWRSVYLLHRHKEVRGISILAVIFFMTWGWWNIYYYPHLNQWLSFYGGLLIVLANTVWVGQMLYYARR